MNILMGQVFAMDVRSAEGRSVYRIVNQEYNENRKHLNDEKSMFKNETLSLINGEVRSARILFDDSYVGRMNRPKVLSTIMLKDVMGDGLIDNDEVDRLRFISGCEPTINYLYDLSDEEIKKMVDAGLYGNPNFERVFNKLMQEETVEFQSSLVYYSLNAKNDENKLVPLVVVDANKTVVERITKTGPESTFGATLDQVLDMAIEIRGDDVAMDIPLIDEFANEREEFASADFEVDESLKAVDSEYQLDLEDSSNDPEVEPDQDDLDYIETTATEDVVLGEDGGLFGESSEDERIRKLKEAARRNVNSKSKGYSGSHVDTEDELDF